MSDDQPPQAADDPLSREEREKYERLKDDPQVQKILASIRRFDEYRDFSSKFLDDFPNNLPRKLPLKLGEAVIGSAEVDWKAVIARLFDWAAAMGKPEEMSEEDYTRQLKEYLESLDKTGISEMMLPLHSTMWHIMEFLPQKLNEALNALALEGRQKVVIREQQKLGESVPSPTKFADVIAKREREAVVSRLPKVTHGGSTPRVEITDEQCSKLSAEYPGLLNHWKTIKKHRSNKANWRGYAKVDEPDTPDDLLDRLADPTSAQEGEAYPDIPSVLAHEHAARRCGIPPNEYSSSRLRSLRQRGDKILRQSKS